MSTKYYKGQAANFMINGQRVEEGIIFSVEENNLLFGCPTYDLVKYPGTDSQQVYKQVKESDILEITGTKILN